MTIFLIDESFLTYNDQFNGIYKTQVIDVLKMYQSEGIKFKLISFLSVKDFLNRENKFSKIILTL